MHSGSRSTTINIANHSHLAPSSRSGGLSSWIPSFHSVRFSLFRVPAHSPGVPACILCGIFQVLSSSLQQGPSPGTFLMAPGTTPASRKASEGEGSGSASQEQLQTHTVRQSHAASGLDTQDSKPECEALSSVVVAMPLLRPSWRCGPTWDLTVRLWPDTVRGACGPRRLPQPPLCSV